MLQPSAHTQAGVPGATPLDDEAAIRQRLRRLVAESSQSRVARATATPQTSLSRYLKDRRIPADFCARLIRALGVNPTWLFTGGGPRYLADIPDDVADSGTTLLKLLRAMNGSASMEVGSLLGSERRRTLVNLRGQLEHFMQTKSDLNQQTCAALEMLMLDFDQSMQELRWDSAQEILPALEQLAELCQDDDLLARARASIADYLMETGNVESALEARRQLFRLGILNRGPGVPLQLRRDANFLIALFRAFRLREAHRVARILVVTHEDHHHEPNYWLIMFAAGQMTFELGDVQTGLAAMLRAYPRLPAWSQPLWYGVLLAAQVICGALRPSEGIELADQRTHGGDPRLRSTVLRALATVVIAGEQLSAVRQLRSTFADVLGDHGTALEPDLEVHCRYLENALALRSPQCDVESYEREYTPLQNSPQALFVYALRRAQLARLSQSLNFDEYAIEAEQRVVALGSEFTPWYSLRMIHFRNVLASKTLVARHDEAREFLQLRDDNIG